MGEWRTQPQLSIDLHVLLRFLCSTSRRHEGPNEKWKFEKLREKKKERKRKSSGKDRNKSQLTCAEWKGTLVQNNTTFFRPLFMFSSSLVKTKLIVFHQKNSLLCQPENKNCSYHHYLLIVNILYYWLCYHSHFTSSQFHVPVNFCIWKT